MGTLLTIISILIALAALVAQFYFKWVPNPEDQRRHFKRAGVWLWHIFTLGSPVACLITMSRYKAPVTPGFVVGVALVASGLSLTVALVIFRAFFAFLSGAGSNSGDGIMGLASITRGIIDALCLLANEPNLSTETTHALRKLLYGASATQQIKGQ
jgi:hypothetical protein